MVEPKKVIQVTFTELEITTLANLAGLGLVVLKDSLGQSRPDHQEVYDRSFAASLYAADLLGDDDWNALVRRIQVLIRAAFPNVRQRENTV